MRKVVFLLICIGCNITSYSQTPFEREYYQIIDSLICIFSEQIKSNLSEQGVNLDNINLWDDSQIFIGDALLFKAIKGSKKPILLYSQGYDHKRNHKKFSEFGSFRFQIFSKSVESSDGLPYGLFDYIDYEFIAFRKEDAVYGNYRFTATPYEIVIVDRTWKVITDPEVLEQILRSHF